MSNTEHLNIEEVPAGYMKKTGAKKKQGNDLELSQYGSIIFGVGLLIVIIAAFLNLGQTSTKVVIATLVVLGLIIGALNVTRSESVSFLVATIALVLLLSPFLGLLGQYFMSSGWLQEFFRLVIALLVPAAVVVALKTLFLTAKDE